MNLLNVVENDRLFCFTVKVFEEDAVYSRDEFTEIFEIGCLDKTIFNCPIEFRKNIIIPDHICIREALWRESSIDLDPSKTISHGVVFANIALLKKANRELVDLLKSDAIEVGYMFSVSDDEWEDIDSNLPLHKIRRIDNIPMLIFTEV